MPPKQLPRPRCSIAVRFEDGKPPEVIDHDSDHFALKRRIRKRGRSAELPRGGVVLVIDCRDQSLSRTYNREDTDEYQRAMNKLHKSIAVPV